MEDITKEEKEIRQKISSILGKSEVTEEECTAVYDEAMEFRRKLPVEQRGTFYWKSGLEMLFMMTKYSKNIN